MYVVYDVHVHCIISYVVCTCLYAVVVLGEAWTVALNGGAGRPLCGANTVIVG
eukprot:SAG31_NODE_43039_length_269_cov_0.541176_1_plen_52_part_01